MFVLGYEVPIQLCIKIVARFKKFRQRYRKLAASLGKCSSVMGVAIAEGFKALLVREKISENQKDPMFASQPGQLKNVVK